MYCTSYVEKPVESRCLIPFSKEYSKSSAFKNKIKVFKQKFFSRLKEITDVGITLAFQFVPSNFLSG